jgi:hypothetical protein
MTEMNSGNFPGGAQKEILIFGWYGPGFSGYLGGRGRGSSQERLPP